MRREQQIRLDVEAGDVGSTQKLLLWGLYQMHYLLPPHSIGNLPCLMINHWTSEGEENYQRSLWRWDTFLIYCFVSRFLSHPPVLDAFCTKPHSFDCSLRSEYVARHVSSRSVCDLCAKRIPNGIRTTEILRCGVHLILELLDAFRISDHTPRSVACHS